MGSSNDDLQSHAISSSVDFYELLSIKFTATESEIRTAFRKTSLKYHPDKVGDTPNNVDKFLLVKTAYDVLSDPRIRVLYDRTREAADRKKVETEKLEAGRRKMVIDLERREKEAKDVGLVGVMGVKRSRNGEEETLKQKLDREIDRIAEENRQKKSILMESMERERVEEDQRVVDEKQARERIASSKERSGRKIREEQSPFTFHPMGSGPSAWPSGTEVQTPSASGTTYEQTILGRLKMRQREKEGRKQVEEETGVDTN